MIAAVIKEFGGPEVIKVLSNVPIPVIESSRQVVILSREVQSRETSTPMHFESIKGSVPAQNSRTFYLYTVGEVVPDFAGKDKTLICPSAGHSNSLYACLCYLHDIE